MTDEEYLEDKVDEDASVEEKLDNMIRTRVNTTRHVKFIPEGKDRNVYIYSFEFTDIVPPTEGDKVTIDGEEYEVINVDREFYLYTEEVEDDEYDREKNGHCDIYAEVKKIE